MSAALLARVLVIAATVFMSRDAFSQSANIAQIIQTHRANQARFDQLYKGKTLTAEGKVLSVKKQQYLQVLDTLGTDWRWNVSIDVNGSMAVCDTKDTEVAASLEPGKTISFTGTVNGVFSNALDVTNCTFPDNEVSARRKREKAVLDRLWTCEGILDIGRGGSGTIPETLVLKGSLPNSCPPIEIVGEQRQAVLRVCELTMPCRIKGTHTNGKAFANFGSVFYEHGAWTRIDHVEKIAGEPLTTINHRSADWVFLPNSSASDQDIIIVSAAYDRYSKRGDKRFIQARALENFERRKDGTKASAVLVQEYDCLVQRSRTLTREVYSDWNAKGSKVTTDTKATEWIQPSNPSLLNAICKS